MNALQHAYASINNLRALLGRTRAARQQLAQRQPLQVHHTRILASGRGMFRIIDAESGRVLGFRSRFRDAHQLAAALERGTAA